MTLPDDLHKLEDLHRSGALSDEGFARAKQRILASTPAQNAPDAVTGRTPSVPVSPSAAVPPAVRSTGEVTWFPSPEVKDFNGNPLPGDLDFFVSPPPEIGTLYSAFSTLKRGQQPMGPVARFGCAVGGALLGGVVGFFMIPTPIILWFDRFWLLLALGALGVIGILAGAIEAWKSTALFTHSCSYVGMKGIARFRCKGAREKLTAREILLFQPDLQCEASVRANYPNKSYESTSYTFAWKDPIGRIIYAVQGSHNSEENTPPMDNEFWYGSAAYTAWGGHPLGGGA